MSSPGESSGLLTTTAGAAISNVKQGVLQAISVTNGTVTLHDGTDTSGKVIAKVTAPATDTIAFSIDDGTSFMRGLFAVVAGASCEAIVYFRRGA